MPFKKPTLKSLGIGRDAIYHVYFHGPAYQVLERASVEGREAIGLMVRDLPPNSVPPDAASLVEPRLVEFLFQTAGIWEIVTEKRLALPSTLRSLRVLRPADKAEGRLFALVRREDDASFSASVVDETGSVFVEIFQNCPVFNDGAYTFLTDKAVKADAILRMEHGKPLLFGKDNKKGIRFNARTLGIR